MDEIIFNIYKDKVFKIEELNNILRNEYKINDPYDIIVRLVNYQIDKYGSQLIDRYITKQDILYNLNRDKNRRYKKRSYYKNRRYKI